MATGLGIVSHGQPNRTVGTVGTGGVVGETEALSAAGRAVLVLGITLSWIYERGNSTSPATSTMSYSHWHPLGS
jgi:hypothetical protein